MNPRPMASVPIVMTPGVAPRASIACTLRMDTKPTTLPEFAAADQDARAGSLDGDVGDASPEQNADEIQFLAEQMQTLTDQVGTIVDELEQLDTAPSGTDAEPNDDGRMFQ